MGSKQVGFGGGGKNDGDQYVDQDGGGHGGGVQEQVHGCHPPA